MRLHTISWMMWTLTTSLALTLGACKGGDGTGETPHGDEPAAAAEATQTEATPEPPPDDGAQAPVRSGELSQTLLDAVAKIPLQWRDAVVPAGIDLAAGKVTFDTSCVSCHGANAQGDGPAASFLTPPPGDLSDPARSGKTTVGEKVYLVLEGVDGSSAMPSFKAGLSEQQVWQVVVYLESLKPTE